MKHQNTVCFSLFYKFTLTGVADHDPDHQLKNEEHKLKKEEEHHLHKFKKDAEHLLHKIKKDQEHQHKLWRKEIKAVRVGFNINAAFRITGFFLECAGFPGGWLNFT